MHFNFTIRRPLLSALLRRTFLILAKSTGIFYTLPFNFGNISFGIMVTFLKNILQEINSFSSCLNLDNTSVTEKMTNLLQSACASVSCFWIFLSHVKQTGVTSSSITTLYFPWSIFFTLLPNRHLLHITQTKVGPSLQNLVNNVILPSGLFLFYNSSSFLFLLVYYRLSNLFVYKYY